MPELALRSHVLRWSDRAPSGARESGGAPVVLIHSSGMSSRQWRRLEDELASTHRVLTPDLLGYGESSPYLDEAEFSFHLDQLALEHLLDAVGEPVHLVGHSYGGFLALLVALHRPRAVRSIAVYEPVSFGVLRSRGDEEALATLPASETPFPESVEAIETWLEGFVDYWNGPGGWANQKDAVKEAFRKSARKMIGEVRSLGVDRTPHQAYALLEVPVLLLGGQRSTLAAHRVLETMAAHIPNARHEVIEGAGHMGPLTHAAEVNAKIAAHVRATSR